MKKVVTGIDIGTHMTRVIVTEPMVSRHTPPKILAVGKAETRGVHHGYVINVHEAAKSIKQAIRQAEKNLGQSLHSAYVSIGGISLDSEIVVGSMIISKADGTISDHDVQQILDTTERNYLKHNKNKRVVHAQPISYRLDDQDVLGNPEGLRGTKLEIKIIFITALEHHVNDLINTVTNAGIDVRDILASPVALAQVALTPKQRIAGCLLADIGAETVSCAVFEDSHLISLKVFPIGSSNITNDIALGFRIPLEEAETIKLQGASQTNNLSVTKKKLEEIIEARLSDIFELIEKHLKTIRRDGLLPGGIIITGGGSYLATIEDFARAVLRIPSKVMTTEHLANNRKDLSTSWLVAYGLCFSLQDNNQDDTGLFGETFKAMGKTIKEFISSLLP